MGGRTSKVAPSKTAIEVAPVSGPMDSLENSQILNSTYGRRSSGSSTSPKGHSRPASQRSKRPLSRYSGKAGFIQGAHPRAIHFSRPGSRSSFRLTTSYGKGDGLKTISQTSRISSDPSNSFRRHMSQHQNSITDPNPCETDSLDEGMSYLLKVQGYQGDKLIATLCPSCNSQFSNFVHLPFLLLCGHSFCSNCLERALRNDPPSLKCGVCGICTPIEPQSRPEDFVKNEAILDLIGSEDFASVISNSKLDRCAECEKNSAVMYCSECSASYCESCNLQQHTGSKVRSKHKPVSITLKPRPQPTCKKHPGQSCVLYCETERLPMCVLCKFYGQHKFHNYQLLNNSATAYRNSLSTKLDDMKKLEGSLYELAQSQSKMKQEIRNKAMESQDKLEKHFIDTRNELIAALEHREAVLLCLLDKQVELREQILQEQRMEVAAALSRTIAAKEEVTRLLEINPISALLTRKHMDNVLDNVLKQTASFTPSPHNEDNTQKSNMQLLPVGLRPKSELTSKLQQVLNQHGAVLQLPGKVVISNISVHSTSIVLRWELPDQNAEVTADRTLIFSLQCYADVPFKFKKDKLVNFKKRFLNIGANSPGLSQDSGYHQDGSSDCTSQSSDIKSCNLPSIPASLRTSSSHNVSLITMQTPDMKDSNGKLEDHKEKLKTSNSNTPQGQVLQKTPVLPQSVRLAQTTPAARASGALLSLPPLLTKDGASKVNTRDIQSPSDSEHDPMSGSNLSGMLSDNEDTPRPNRQQQVSQPPPPPQLHTQMSSQTTDASSSNSTLSDEPTETSNNHAINIGRFCKGYAFEEIYCGQDSQFSYSGIVTGATYYFRVQCRNAVGEGPWSDTHKCSIIPSIVKR